MTEALNPEVVRLEDGEVRAKTPSLVCRSRLETDHQLLSGCHDFAAEGERRMKGEEAHDRVWRRRSARQDLQRLPLRVISLTPLSGRSRRPIKMRVMPDPDQFLYPMRGAAIPKRNDLSRSNMSMEDCPYFPWDPVFQDNPVARYGPR
jgi:hypothetical protein